MDRAFVIRQEPFARGAAGVISMPDARMWLSMYKPARTPELFTSVGVPSGVDQVLFRSPGYLSPQKEPGAKNIRAL